MKLEVGGISSQGTLMLTLMFKFVVGSDVGGAQMGGAGQLTRVEDLRLTYWSRLSH